MLKSILLFIKAHTVATAITTTVVVGVAIATSIAVNNYILDKRVKEHLETLGQDYVQEISENQTIEENQAIDENIVADENEPLTFRIERVELEDGGRTYKIIPSYEKEYSKWTKAEKQAFEKAWEERIKIADEDVANAIKSEQEKMAQAIEDIAKTNASFSKYYVFEYCYISSVNNDGNPVLTWPSEEWRYNTFTKKYYGSTWAYDIEESELGEISIDTFKSIVYPSLLQKIETTYNARIKAHGTPLPNELKEEFEKEKQENLNKLNELLNLSN